jgi:hypothetical protein
MAQRPVFVPHLSAAPWVRAVPIEFVWYPGFAVSQAQKSIVALHAAATEQGIAPLLEISSKSAQAIGVALSAFNLTLTHVGQVLSVECAFQGSKVFANGGPFRDLYAGTSREAKTDPRLRSSGPLTAFDWHGTRWPLVPRTAFYDWLYLTALSQHPELAQAVLGFVGFTDIVFNPDKALNCQAHSAALYAALHRRGQLPAALTTPTAFLAAVG